MNAQFYSVLGVVMNMILLTTIAAVFLHSMKADNKRWCYITFFAAIFAAMLLDGNVHNLIHAL